jgi:hypothetical protein
MFLSFCGSLRKPTLMAAAMPIDPVIGHPYLPPMRSGTLGRRECEVDPQQHSLVGCLREPWGLSAIFCDEPIFPFRRPIRPFAIPRGRIVLFMLGSRDAPPRWLRGQEEFFPLLSGQATRDRSYRVVDQLLRLGKALTKCQREGDVESPPRTTSQDDQRWALARDVPVASAVARSARGPRWPTLMRPTWPDTFVQDQGLQSTRSWTCATSSESSMSRFRCDLHS